MWGPGAEMFIRYDTRDLVGQAADKLIEALHGREEGRPEVLLSRFAMHDAIVPSRQLRMRNLMNQA